MRMNIDFTTHIYEIDFLPFLGEEEEAYQKAFDEWYYEDVVYQEESGEETHCMQQRSDLDFDFFDIDVVLTWFKKVSPNCGVKIISRYSGDVDCDKALPTMYF